MGRDRSGMSNRARREQVGEFQTDSADYRRYIAAGKAFEQHAIIVAGGDAGDGFAVPR